MNQKALKTLEYTKIIAQLEEFAASEPGKRLCRELVPSASLEEIRTWQSQTTDAVSRIRMKGSLSFAGTKDVGSSLKRLDIGSSLKSRVEIIVIILGLHHGIGDVQSPDANPSHNV